VESLIIMDGRMQVGERRVSHCRETTEIAIVKKRLGNETTPALCWYIGRCQNRSKGQKMVRFTRA